jgi:putative spermidine/putrescine transport system permease protein
VNAFRTESGSFTTENVANLLHHEYLGAYRTSIEVSLASAAIGGTLGALMAYAAVGGGAPRWIRPLLTTFSGVAANFAGVPLAFAFVATLGTTGMVTRLLADHLGIDLYAGGFSLFTFWGVVLTYVYFQIPLMILVVAPAIEGLRPQWREAAEGLGAGPWQYWTRVGLPVLAPSLLGAGVLLFGNAFSAYATAQALTSGGVNIVPILIGNLMSGNVLSNPHQAQALALGMIVVIALSMVAYALLMRRAARWRR